MLFDSSLLPLGEGLGKRGVAGRPHSSPLQPSPKGRGSQKQTIRFVSNMMKRQRLGRGEQVDDEFNLDWVDSLNADANGPGRPDDS